MNPGDDDEPIQLVGDEFGDGFLVYATDKGLRLDLQYVADTLWMTQALIAQLFGRDISTVSRHIANILEERELEESSSLRKTQTTRPAGDALQPRYGDFRRLPGVVGTSHALPPLGDRSSGPVRPEGVRRRCATAERGGKHRPHRRASRDHSRYPFGRGQCLRRTPPHCSLCQDYDGSSETARAFYQRTQAKLVFAVVSQTPSEIIASRADHRSEKMGQQTWPHDHIRKADAVVSKNYLTELEVRELNRLTSILLDIFEDQLDLGRLVVMKDAQDLLDRQLRQLGRTVLRTGGSVSGDDARLRAETEYEAYARQRRLGRRVYADESIAELVRGAKGLPKTPRR